MANSNLLEQVEKNDKKKAAEEESRSQYVLQAYKNRLRFVKEGHIYAARNDFTNAASSYHNYLESIALFYGVTQDKLHPSIFKRGTEDIPEQMLMSLVYWEMAKIFDRNPKMAGRLKFTLDQFVKFSTGNKFQFLNAENMRKYIHKGACVHVKLFDENYKRIQINSKKCFVATFTLGEGHVDLLTFYQFRDKILPYRLGQSFVNFYYQFSPFLVRYLENHQIIGTSSRFILTPVLRFLAKLMRKTIL